MKGIYIVVSVLCILCILFAGLLAKSSMDELNIGSSLAGNNQGETENTLYRKINNPTDLQKEIYDELCEATENYPDQYDDFKLAELVVKSFIADFYTWTNKAGNYDVGGLDYIYGPNHMMFALYARDTFYQNFNFFKEEYGVENLIEVETVNIEKVDWAQDVEIDENTYSAYYVQANWTYKTDSKLDLSKFQNRAYYVVINNLENNRFEIAYTYELEMED